MECTRKGWSCQRQGSRRRRHYLSSRRHVFPYFHQVYFICFTVLLLSPISDAELIFANRKNICLINESQFQMGHFNSSVIVSGLEDVHALNFDFEDKLIFWADMGLEAIKGTRLSQNHIFTLVTDVSPDEIACDWINKKLYWVDSETSRIEVCDYDGSNRKVLINDEIDQPRAIVLVPNEGIMFWSDVSEYKIERVSMNGNRTTRKVIVSCRNPKDENNGKDVSLPLCIPTSLAVDYNTKRLFWADTLSQMIYSVDFDGGNRKVILQHANISVLFGLTLHGRLISWTSRNVESPKSMPGIFFYDLQTINLVTYVTMHSYDYPFGLISFDGSRQPLSANPCKQPTAGCSHLCLLSSEPPYYSCSCPFGLSLMEDGKTCPSEGKNFLLVARRTVIEWLSLDTDDFLYIPIPMPKETIKNAITLDYDPVEGKVYWPDDEKRTMNRAFMNGSQIETIISTGINYVDGMSIDWISRNFYWTDSASKTIRVARLDGSWSKILIKDNLDKIRAIAVHPAQGLLFWSDWGDKGRIERALMDATERTVIINTDIVWPNGLAIDYELSKIYWCDAKLDRVEMANFDGSARVKLEVSSGLSHMFGFSLLGEWLYWTDWQDRTVVRAHKLTGGSKQMIGENIPDLMGIKASSFKVTPGTNACSVNYGNCSHLCLPRSQHQYSCACANGYDLAPDLKSCLLPESYLLFMSLKVRNLQMGRISLQTKAFETVPLSSLHPSKSFDIDIEENRIYWVDSIQQKISRSFINGSNSEDVVRVGIKSPESVAVDWISKNLYWTDSEMHRIEVARIDGSFRRIFISDSNRSPHSLVISPIDLYLFWSDWAQLGKIERVSLDGVQRMTIVDSSFQAYSLTIDHTEKRLYWISTHIPNSNGPRIMSVFFDGNQLRTHLEEMKSNAISLAIYNNYIYYINQSASAIEKIPKSNITGTPEIFKKDEIYSTTSGLSVYNILDQLGWNFCKTNDKCEHLCFARMPPKGNDDPFQCACAAHYIANEGHCYPPNSFLLFSQKSQITRFLFEHKQKSDLQEMTYAMPTKPIKKLAYDPFENRTYWIDMKGIRRINLDGSGYETVQNLIQPVDLVIDPYARLLFWTCNMTNTINVTRIMTDKPISMGAIHSSNYDQPRLLAYHFRFNYLYWTNQLSGSARIERISLPNLIKDTVVRDNLEEVTALTVDNEMNYLIWFNTGSKKIEYSNLHGGSRIYMLHEHRLHPIAMTTHSKYLFCVVGREKKLVVKLPLDLNNGNNIQTIFTRPTSITDIISVTPVITSSSYMACQNENGGCSHLCFITNHTDHKKCGCPKGLILSQDEQTCIEPSECKSDEFRCHTGRCILNTLRCNGKNDCPDRSDENHCPTCGVGQFTCMIKNELVCLDEKHRCNGVRECFDAKDEFCCEKDKFLCKSTGNCLPVFQVCDGKRDCLEGEDEESCQRTRPPPTVPSAPLPTSGSLFSYNIYIPVIFLILILVLVSYYQCRRFTDGTEEKDSGTTSILMTEHPFTSSAGIARNNRNPERNAKKSVMLMSVLGKNHGKQEPGCNTLTTTTTISGLDTLSNEMLLNGTAGPSGHICHSVTAGGESLIERNITGASSTSSSAHVTYPRETTNPPPSPATSSYSSALFVPRSRQKSNVPPNRKSKKSKKSSGHKKAKMPKSLNRGPPPTPCSTDVYEDLEPSSIKYSMYYDNNHTDLDDFDYKPPPPTPRHYFSDPSSPPSPETERSYRAHYPPPPSPVPEFGLFTNS